MTLHSPRLRGRILAATGAALTFTGFLPNAHAVIDEVIETGLRTSGTIDAPAIIVRGGFTEDALAFSDRVHQHNGAAFNNTGVLNTTGTNIVPIPNYLIGADYVRIANNARDNANYNAVVTTTQPADFYLFIDNRSNGTAGNTSSPNTTDPVLGGRLTWVVEDGWLRVNTGISPNNQPDYTAIDEGGTGVGPGQGLNQFYSIYRRSALTEVTLKPQNIGGGNMYSLVVTPAENPDAIIRFFSGPPSVLEGDAVPLRWQISPRATRATITGLGNILPDTDADGVGQALAFPDKTTTYTLAVESPLGTETRTLTVEVYALASFTRTQTIIPFNGTSTLQWAVSPYATSIMLRAGVNEPIDVLDITSANGTGSMPVFPQVDTTYTLTVTTPFAVESATTSIQVMLLSRLTATPAFFDSGGGTTTLDWRGRPDAVLTLSGVGPVTMQPEGTGTATVTVPGTTTFTLTGQAGNRTETLTVTVRAQLQGTPFALLDIGATGGTVQAGAANNAQIGAGIHNQNGLNLAPVNVTAATGETFTVALDNISPTGSTVGALDWRDRGDSTVEFGAIAEDFVKNNAGIVRVILGNLPAGNYDVLAFNIDSDFAQSSTINIWVSDADRPNPVDTGIVADSSYPPGHVLPGALGITASDISTRTRLFPIRSDGSGQVRIIFDGRGGSDDETPLNGLLLVRTDGAAVPVRIVAFNHNPATRASSMTFTSSPGETYRVEASQNLADWIVIAPSVAAATGAETTYLDPNPDAPRPRRFYRVRKN
jgi:hypothetical protein